MRKLLLLFFSLFIISTNIANAEPVPIHDTVGAGGLLEKYNDLKYKSKKIYLTSCIELPGDTEEVYLIETNVGDLGDNVFLVYPNKQGTINKVIILVREDGRLEREPYKILTEEIMTLFYSFILPSSNEDEATNLIGTFIQAGKTGKSSFWSVTQGRRYIIERFRTVNNNVPFANVRITARI